MNPTKPFWTKWRVVAVVLAMCSTGPIYLVNQHDRKVKAWIEEQIRFTHYRFGRGLEHDLCVGNIKADDTVEYLLQKYPTLTREEYGHWTFIYQDLNRDYPLILAKDGQLISSYVFYKIFYLDTFFETKLTPEEKADALQACLSILKKRKDKVACDTLKVALAGVAANVRFLKTNSTTDDYDFPNLEDFHKD